jgi:hypothetical protein
VAQNEVTAVFLMNWRRQLSWLQVRAISGVVPGGVGVGEEEKEDEDKKDDGGVVDGAGEDGVGVGDVVGVVMSVVVGIVVGVVVGVVDVVDDVNEDGGGPPDTAVTLDTPTQAFQFSIVQVAAIGAPAISTIVVFWPLIIRQIVTVT